MNKHFANQIFCYLAALFFLWVMVGQIVELNLTIDKLIKVNGIVERKVEVIRKGKRASRHLRIYLKNNPDYFRFMEVYHYEKFSYMINPGDSVEIYVRPRWLVPLGLGNKNDIFQMSSNGETIFQIADTRKNSIGIIIVCALFIPVFYFLARYSRKKYLATKK